MSEARIVDRLDQRLNERLHSHGETCQTKLKWLEDEIQKVKDDVSKLGEACETNVQRLEDRIEEVSDDVDCRVDLEVEDRVLGIKIDLEDFVKDELKNTEETLKDRLAEASISFQFNDLNHLELSYTAGSTCCAPWQPGVGDTLFPHVLSPAPGIGCAVVGFFQLLVLLLSCETG